MLAALGVERSRLPVELYDNGSRHVFVVLGSEDEVAALEPDLQALRRLPVGVNCLAGEGGRWKTRMFAPGARRRRGSGDRLGGGAARAPPRPARARRGVGARSRSAGRGDRPALDALRDGRRGARRGRPAPPSSSRVASSGSEMQEAERATPAAAGAYARRVAPALAPVAIWLAAGAVARAGHRPRRRLVPDDRRALLRAARDLDRAQRLAAAAVARRRRPERVQLFRSCSRRSTTARSCRTALHRAHVFDAFLFASAAVPAYLLARRVTRNGWLSAGSRRSRSPSPGPSTPGCC